MRKRSFFPTALILGLLLSSCATETAPAIPTVIPPTIPPATPTAGPSTVGGEFVLNNTSTPGMEAGIETMNIQLRYRSSTTDPWNTLAAECSFDPPAPLVLKTTLTVHYECEPQSTPPENAELQAIVEVKLFGVDQPYQMEIAVPDPKH